jgi:hypothetical protein
MSEILNFGFSDLFCNGKSVDSVHASWTTASGRSTVDPLGGADGETAEEWPGWRSGVPVLTDADGEGEGWYGGLATRFTGARGAAEWPAD